MEKPRNKYKSIVVSQLKSIRVIWNGKFTFSYEIQLLRLNFDSLFFCLYVFTFVVCLTFLFIFFACEFVKEPANFTFYLCTKKRFLFHKIEFIYMVLFAVGVGKPEPAELERYTYSPTCHHNCAGPHRNIRGK